MTDDKLDLAGRVPAPRLSFVICHLLFSKRCKRFEWSLLSIINGSYNRTCFTSDSAELNRPECPSTSQSALSLFQITINGFHYGTAITPSMEDQGPPHSPQRSPRQPGPASSMPMNPFML